MAKYVQPINEKIQQRRIQMLLHSRIYYELGENIVSDFKFNEWAHELVDLQRDYPDVAKEVIWAEAFEGWTGDSGSQLPLNDPWVVRYTDRSIYIHNKLHGDD